MNIKDIKLSELSPVYLNTLILSNVKKNVRKVLDLPKEYMDNPENYKLLSFNVEILDSILIKDLFKEIRHENNFDTKDLNKEEFLEVYGKNITYGKEFIDLQLMKLELSLDTIDDFSSQKYREYQTYNLRRLLSDNTINLIRSNPDNFVAWKK